VTWRSVEQEIHALEEQRDHALLLADSDTLTRLLDDGLVYTYWSGSSDGKSNYLEGVKSGRFLYRNIERPDERIQVYDGLAVVTGRAHVEVVVSGQDRAADVRYTSVWAKDTYGWRTVAYQTTPILGM
jgi:Domain of unknown function (DUF4440)